ncbi:MAG: hypothetical protein Q7K21_08610, partial [Elusimicrobiota bacterium]|nr:hypothetical protein [Elusimicrobiota bacterium]
KIFLILIVWLFSPILLLILFRIRVYPHYMVIQYPVQFIFIAIFLDSLQKFLKKTGTAITAIIIFFILFSNVFSTLKFYGLIDKSGGAPGDYGTSYKFKKQAVLYMLNESQGLPQFVSDGLTDKKLSLEYQYLILYNSRIMFGITPKNSSKKFFILDTFRYSQNFHGISTRFNRFPLHSFGPIYVYTISD